MTDVTRHEMGAKKSGFFKRLRTRLNRTPGSTLGSLDWFRGRRLDEDLLEEIEERLLLADAGIDATRMIVEGLGKRAKGCDAAAVQGHLRELMLEILEPRARPLEIAAGKRPYVILVVGVNGSGKTTTIGKLAKRYAAQGYSVLLAAGDTYRAAAVEQLQEWGRRNNVPVVSQQTGADAAAVIYDALEAARARNIDVVLADTAGRLQNQEGLMRELGKIVRVTAQIDPTAPHEKMLVLDASQGQNALAQVEQFNDAVGLTGITMTKLDSGGRGGILFAIATRLDVPIRFVGVGEQADDMDIFDAAEFVDAVLEVPGTVDREEEKG